VGKRGDGRIKHIGQLLAIGNDRSNPLGAGS
jgi:hypothetical protein